MSAILNELQRRDRQMKPLAELCKECNLLFFFFFFLAFKFSYFVVVIVKASVAEQQRLRQTLAQVEREKSLLLQEKDNLQKKMGNRSLESSEIMDARFKENEDKLHQLQTQLAEAYKKNSDNVEKMLAALSGQRDAETKATGKRTDCFFFDVF
jgi:septal ring factor EnvC (AmiA/AmiB activator)